MQRRIFGGKGEEKRGIGGAGGLRGIGGRAQTNNRGREGGKGHRWCRRVEGNRGQSTNNTTGEGKVERNLFGPKSVP